MKKILLLLLTAASLSAAPQAIVFDFGGVMTGHPNREIVVQFIRDSLDLSPAEFETANQHKKKALKAGMTDEEFWLEFARKKGILLPDDWSQKFKSAMKEAIGVDPEMFALVNQLKERHIPVALLSNIDERLSKLIREFGYYEPFHPCLLSHELGVEKPDPRVYKLLLDQFDFPPEDVVFIDDREENIIGAKKMKLDAILFKSAKQLRRELSRRGLL